MTMIERCTALIYENLKKGKTKDRTGNIMAKRQGCSIIFADENNRILLFLRDDKPGLPYANMWDIPGGHVEQSETPEDCIIREMKEEIDVDLENQQLFRVYEFDDRIEHVFLSRQKIDCKSLVLTEGQDMRWFTELEISRTPLAYGFNRVATDFFESIRTVR